MKRHQTLDHTPQIAVLIQKKTIVDVCRMLALTWLYICCLCCTRTPNQQDLSKVWKIHDDDSRQGTQFVGWFCCPRLAGTFSKDSKLNLERKDEPTKLVQPNLSDWSHLETSSTPFRVGSFFGSKTIILLQFFSGKSFFLWKVVGNVL